MSEPQTLITALTVSPSGVPRLSLRGALTIYEAQSAAAELHAALEQAADGGLELDLTGVDDIDTAGLQLLLVARRTSATRGHFMRIVAASTPVNDVIQFCGLSGFFDDTPAARVG